MRELSLQNIKPSFLSIKYITAPLQFMGLMFLSMILQYPPYFSPIAVFYVFQERDILRAQELLNGNFIFFGPELTGGGNLPGPFYYFLLSPSLLFGLEWVGAWTWMFILLSLGGVLGWYFFRSKYNTLTAFLWLILYSLALPTILLTQVFLNPSFSILFIVLINIYTLKAFGENSQVKRNRAFILACFFVGLAIQLHYSSLPYLFSLILLQIFAKKLKIFSVDLKKFYLGLGVFGLTLAPFLIWQFFKKFKIELGQLLPYGGTVTNALPSLFSHFKTSLDTTISQFLFLAVQKLFLVIPAIFLIFAVLQLIFSGEKKEPTDRHFIKTDNSVLIKILSVCLFFSFIPFSFYFFVPQGSRYGAQFSITISFLAVVIYDKFQTSKAKLKYFNLISLFVLIGTCIFIFFADFTYYSNEVIKILILFFSLLLIAYFHRNKMQVNNSAILLSFILTGCLALAQANIQNRVRYQIHKGNNAPAYAHWKKIWIKILNDTGWSYSEAIQRIYFINHHIEQSPKMAYELLVKSHSKKQAQLSILPDGYFVSIVKPVGQETLKWLIEQPIQEEIRTGLLSGDIIIGEHDTNSNVLVAPYFVVNKKSLPSHFHNTGLGYRKLPEENLLRSFEDSVGVKKIADNEYLFKWNECLDKHHYCDTGVIARVTKEQSNVYRFDIKVVGLPLSQSSLWISPGWTQAWIGPYLEIKCGETTKLVKIASSIGYNHKYLGLDSFFKYQLTNNSLLAPFKRSFEVQCKGLLSEISIGRESSSVEQVTGLINLPKQKLTIKL